MGVEEKLEDRCNIAAFGLILLGHGEANDCACVERREIEGVFLGSKNLDDVGIGEIVQVAAIRMRARPRRKRLPIRNLYEHLVPGFS